MRKQGSVSVELPAGADDVFALVTDVARLPEWNERIVALESPPGPLTVGERWTVRVDLPGKRFASESEVLELDPRQRRFAHRSKPVDANPSFSVWTWEVTPTAGGCRVQVSWTLEPRTFGRRLVTVVRSRMLPAEVTTSIQRLGAVVGAGAGA